MPRLQAVAHIRQRAVDDDRHCVGDERPLHLLFQIHRDEFVPVSYTHLRDGIAVGNLLDGDVVRLHEFNLAFHPRVEIFRKGNQELVNRRVFVDELKSVDMVP